MIASSHLMVGAALGAIVASAAERLKQKKYWIAGLLFAPLLGIISHFVLDMIPHEEYSLDNKWLLIVLAIETTGVIFLLFLAGLPAMGRKCMLITGLCVIGASMPDIPDVIIKVFSINWPWLVKADLFNGYFHAPMDAPYKIDIFTQLLIAILGFFVIAVPNVLRRRE